MFSHRRADNFSASAGFSESHGHGMLAAEGPPMACTTPRLFALALLLTLGCSSEDAEDKCSALVSDFCNSVADCAIEAGQIASADKSSFLGECVNTGESTIGCSKAVDVSSNYDSCMSAIHALECSDLQGSVVLPSQCQAVIEVED
jgi:hypothetical protein